MKLIPLFALFLLPLAAPGVASGRDTAYQALRAIGAERNQTLLHRVIELKGRNGTPQPEKWTVILDDPLARGGVREIEVANGRIVSERTPVKAYSGRSDGIAMNLEKLNLDSEGAFTVASDEARNAKIGFESVDYVLRCEDANTAPSWVLQLLDENQRSIASITIAADNGAVLSKSFGSTDSGSKSKPDAISSDSDTNNTTDEDEQAPKKGLFNRMNRDIHHIGADFQEFFTGRRTIDRQFRDQ